MTTITLAELQAILAAALAVRSARQSVTARQGVLARAKEMKR